MAAQPERTATFPSPVAQEDVVLEALRIGESRELEAETIPLKEIESGDFLPVDETHVEALMGQMSFVLQSTGQPFGQQDPIWLTRIDGRLHILNGFHRYRARERLAQEQSWPPEISAIVFNNLSWPDVYRIRAIGATRHRTVRFSRLCLLADQTWQLSPWSQKGISLVEALRNLNRLSSLVERRGLTKDESEQLGREVKEWLSWWGMERHSMVQQLSLGRQLAPAVLFKVQVGAEDQGISLSCAEVMAEILPGAKNFPVQKEIANVIEAQSLTRRQARKLIENVKTRLDENLPYRDLLAKDWNAQAKRRPKSSEQVNEQKDKLLIMKLWEDIEEIAKLRVKVMELYAFQLVVKAMPEQVNLTAKELLQLQKRLALLVSDGAYGAEELEQTISELRPLLIAGEQESLGITLDHHEQKAVNARLLLEAAKLRCQFSEEKVDFFCKSFTPYAQEETLVVKTLDGLRKVRSRDDLENFLAQHEQEVPASKQIFFAQLRAASINPLTLANEEITALRQQVNIMRQNLAAERANRLRGKEKIEQLEACAFFLMEQVEYLEKALAQAQEDFEPALARAAWQSFYDPN